jgi:hypothetical protein
MSFTVALLILALGVLIGYFLPGPVAALRALLQRQRHRPKMLRPWTPDQGAPKTRATPQAPRHHG